MDRRSWWAIVHGVESVKQHLVNQLPTPWLIRSQEYILSEDFFFSVKIAIKYFYKIYGIDHFL